MGVRTERTTTLRLTARGKAVLAIGAVISLLLLALGILGVRALFAGDGGQDDGATGPALPSHTTAMVHATRIEGDISPKSVVASSNGTVIANNMIYNHTVTLYDAATMQESATVADTVDLADFGFPAERAGQTKGAPVEAAFSADGKHAYVTQYGLTGPGSGEASTDKCSGAEAIGRSAIFRLDLASKQWDQVIEVGRVPKFISLSPDGTTALVSNWCDSTVSVVDLEAGKETRTIEVDSAPRGSVILPDGRTAYVTAMYADELYRLDLEAGTSELVHETGRKPRHLTLSPDGTRLYMTEAGADRLVVMDAATAEILDTVSTGREPRSMAISADGTALYVVNYYENTVSKFDAGSLEELQREGVGVHPVGVAYEPTQQRVWVANYQGSIDVFDDSAAVDAAEAEAPAA